MSDLIYPVLYGLACMIIIDYFESKLPLLTICIFNIPICLLFGYQIGAGGYSLLFEVDISNFTDTPILLGILWGCMWIIPIIAILKTYYLQQFVTKEEDGDIIG